MHVTGFTEISAFRCYSAYNNRLAFNGNPWKKAGNDQDNCSKKTE